MVDGDTIFLFGNGDEPRKAPRVDCESEELLQALIEKHPELLSGEQIGSEEEPVRWMLVSREAGIPDDGGVSDRWSVDHLLLDQSARPTFVEVKRSSDTRIRREVVGQMLDYAANAQTHWPVNRIRGLATQQYGGESAAAAEVARLIGADLEDDASEAVEEYWRIAEENLREGNLRLLFVADRLPRELRRIIEFLNGQMSRTDVLGVELRQYDGGELKAVVPRVIGQTEATRDRKRRPQGSSKKTTRGEFIAACPEYARPVFEGVLSEAESRGTDLYWGTKGFSVRPVMVSGATASLLYCFPPGSNGRDVAFIQFYLKDVPENDRAGAREAFESVAAVKPQGKYTLDLEMTQQNVASAEEGLAKFWGFVDRQSSKASSAQETDTMG